MTKLKMTETVCGVKVDKSVKGERYGRLVIIGAMFRLCDKRNIKGQSIHKYKVVCKCDCGERGLFGYHQIKSGKTKSCGCFRKETTIKNYTRHGAAKANDPDIEYVTWSHMLQRCTNSNDKGWKDYGGRGIKVCERWLNSFENFFEDMGRRPSSKHSIDRINNDGNYTPENCRWATRKEQNRNQRTNRLLTVDGETKCLAEWAEIYPISASAIMGRLELGWSHEKAVKTPVKLMKKRN